MAESIGSFIHKKVKAKGLSDKQVAGYFNISPSTLRKYYPLKDMYISKIIEFCELLDEDLILDYYYNKEPLKGFRKRDMEKHQQELAELRMMLEQTKEMVGQLQKHIATQNDLIVLQKREIQRIEKAR